MGDVQRRCGRFTTGVAVVLAGLLAFAAGCTEELGPGQDGEFACAFSAGRYLSRGVVRSNPFAAGQCTWYVDGQTDLAGWDLVFRRGSGRDAARWYAEDLVTNAERGASGGPGDIMVLDKGWYSSFGHVALVIGSGSWHGRRAWTVRHANWRWSEGQAAVATICGRTITECTFVEDTAGSLRIVVRDRDVSREILSGSAFPLLGFLRQR